MSIKIGLISSTFSNEGIRNTAYRRKRKTVGLWQQNLVWTEPLYQALKKVFDPKELVLTVNQKKFLSEGVAVLQKNGMKLSAADRKPLEEINNQAHQIGKCIRQEHRRKQGQLIFTE